ncbi:MAG: ion transporter [Akkermansiaceae bacterium]
MKLNKLTLIRGQYLIQALIVLSLIAFAIETTPDLSPATIKYLYWFEFFTVTVFTIEYLLRIYITKPSTKYIFSFMGIVDLVSILPFYLATSLDLRTVRALRLLRLFRMFKLVRYSSAMKRYQRAFAIAREELIVFGAAALIILYLASVGIYFFENQEQPENFGSVFDSMWWAVATLTTVGYGDVYPITAGGRIFTFFVLITGLGVVAVPTGLVASALTVAREEEKKLKKRAHTKTIDSTKNKS